MSKTLRIPSLSVCLALCTFSGLASAQVAVIVNPKNSVSSMTAD
jgi:hypothetical protein